MTATHIEHEHHMGIILGVALGSCAVSLFAAITIIFTGQNLTPIVVLNRAQAALFDSHTVQQIQPQPGMATSAGSRLTQGSFATQPGIAAQAGAQTR